MNRPISGRTPGTDAETLAMRRSAHELLDELLDQLSERGFFGTGTLELGSQNGKPCKCEADVRRKLRRQAIG